jgi:cyclase
MLKKRIIFTLLYNKGKFALSRNFRLQNAGNLSWLIENYHFHEIALFIDELVVLDVTRDGRNQKEFCIMLRKLSEFCFMPIAAGGGISTINDIDALLKNGADKVVINTAIHENPSFLKEAIAKYGRQAIVGSFDLKKMGDHGYELWTNSNQARVSIDARAFFESVDCSLFGEIYLNSVTQDGTGNGYDLAMLGQLPSNFDAPIILAGGAGNSHHLLSALRHKDVDAVATANLFNFIGDGLKKARLELINSGCILAKWPTEISLQH